MTTIPLDLTVNELFVHAREHLAKLAGQRGFSAPEGTTKRHIVNMLRHRYTDYDMDQSREQHRAVCEAIAEAYPFLSNECAKQIARRSEAEHTKRVKEYRNQPHAQIRKRRARCH